jgi:DnaJ homologue, subfamily C, member 28, conserved domain
MSYSVDKLIEEWLGEKECQELPGTGKPLNLYEYFSWPEDQRIGLSLLKNSGCVPLEVEQLREIKRLSDELEICSDGGLRARLKRRLQEEQVQLNLRLEQSRRRRSR